MLIEHSYLRTLTDLYQVGSIDPMTAEQLVLLGIAARRAEDGSGRRIRESAHLSLRLVAQNIGVAEATVSRWEKGNRKPRGEAAIRWVRLLDQLDRANAKNAA
ncbi:MAG: helix-turn-helix transcriptional regulator [Actinoplanes sp.]